MFQELPFVVYDVEDDEDDEDDDRQPTREVDEVEIEGHLEGEAWNNLRMRKCRLKIIGKEEGETHSNENVQSLRIDQSILFLDIVYI